MKIAITAGTTGITAPFDERFGRCPYFIIIDPETHAWEAKPNPAVHEMGGAGTLAAQFLANIPVDAVISGKFGPKAASVLRAAEIRMLESGAGAVEDVLDRYLAGELAGPDPSSTGQKGLGRGNRSRRQHR